MMPKCLLVLGIFFIFGTVPMEAQCSKCQTQTPVGIHETSYPYQSIFGSEYFKHEDSVSAVGITPDKQYFLSAEGKKIIFWESCTGQKVKSISQMLYGIVSLDVSPDGKKILAEDSC